jgi:exonuclease III
MWTICNVEGTPVHLISVYLPPNDDGTAKYTIRVINWTVRQRIFRKDPMAKVIVMGDLN